jgi:mannose-6-phosphate isomerase
MEPIFFVPFFEEKSWGGHKLSSFYSKYPAGIHIGESWELSGVLYRQTFVRSGTYAGFMLSELYKTYHELFGTDTPYFPFVIKFVDTAEPTPVHAHGCGVKNDSSQSKAWYIIHADEGAQLVTGTSVRNSLELFNAIAEDSIEASLRYTGIDSGDTFHIPPGALHGVGGGVLLYEITSPLLETSQLYDWNKYSENQIDEGVDTFRFNYAIPKCEPLQVSEDRIILFEGAVVILEKIDATLTIHEQTEDKFCVYTALSNGTIGYDGKARSYRSGDTFLIPANSNDYILTGGILIKAYCR